MGIPYAFHYYYSKYNCENELMINFETLSKLNINYLFFDYNSLIHPCSQQILSANHDKYISITDINKRTDIIEKDIINNCQQYTRYVINQVLSDTVNSQDMKFVYLTIDGVAPRSKMNQQRERRYKSEYFKVVKSDSSKSSLWDSNKITPGTLFMNKLKESLISFAKKLQNDLMIKVIVSDASENGEGEHKIMKIINDITTTTANICIYGLDADLIMLSLMNKNSDKIILIRDNTFNNNLSDDKKVIDYLDIKNLRKYIYNDFCHLFREKNVVNLNVEHLINDYIFVCFFLGNDFLEHLPSLTIRKHGIDTVMRAYVNAWKGTHLVNSNKKDSLNWKESINLVYVRDIMYHLKNCENSYFRNLRIDSLASSEKDIYQELSDSNRVYFYNQDLIKFSEEKYKERYYLYYGMSKNHIDDICFNYLEGLYWIFGYYNGHIHKNWSWYYKYNNVPFCSDIFDYLKKNNVNSIYQQLNNSEYLKESRVFTPLKQLCMVLPKLSLKNILLELNPDIYNKLEYTLLNSEKYYPKKIYVDLFNKRYLWQSKIFFDEIDEIIIEIIV